ncbi:hypothetical protein TARUN_1953 [Trichoderma arundinaceum]|uniref:Uncharacterized protein n=1 Tax=Trichoderma arundinaceum TaxID=490622 RepID=A0A395NWV7_TRIAR|nr:hypothetical protein TARUN_1953 [Trichoderma arundinaceum]
MPSTSSSSSASSSQHRSTASRGSNSKSSSKDGWKPSFMSFSKDQGLPLKFFAYTAGATLPTTMKKMTRKMPKDRRTSEWVFSGRETQLFWVLQPERPQQRGRSRNPRERDTYESRPPQQQPMYSFPSEAARAPKPTGGSMGTIPPPSAAGAAGGPMAASMHGHSRPPGFPFGIPSIVNFPGGMPLPPSGRN